ncbi:hypothetical protein [uncultured Brevundimonas sp.]|uniref:hypothetical protein n=1 Tax=uncultured Brevundimonas sp. TaxID=213418 RepID=UPI0025D3B56D|nr:hypothetical protein [uncultured Brevundimonas sp.]
MTTIDFDKVRSLLTVKPTSAGSAYAALAAAALAALSAVAMAGVMVLGAGVSFPDQTEIGQPR